MNRMWSDYVQTSEALNRSRALRFNARNKDAWLNALRIKDGTDVLELGCGGGIFCQRIKEYVPNARVTGLDRDDGHIEYAKHDAAAKNLDVRFIIGDATATPFPDSAFDLCFSYTVAEHIEPDAFFSEQYRILRSGGRVAALCVQSDKNIHVTAAEMNANDEEKALLDKAWKACPAIDERVNVCEYPFHPGEAAPILARNGFAQIDIETFTVTAYAPDNASIPEEEAIESINTARLFAMDNFLICKRLNPASITADELARAEALVNARFDRRIEIYQSGKPLWDLSTSMVLVATGVKP